jgi:hypothetical protein
MQNLGNPRQYWTCGTSTGKSKKSRVKAIFTKNRNKNYRIFDNRKPGNPHKTVTFKKHLQVYTYRDILLSDRTTRHPPRLHRESENQIGRKASLKDQSKTE